jgi:glutamate--cysteine ligase
MARVSARTGGLVPQPHRCPADDRRLRLFVDVARQLFSPALGERALIGVEIELHPVTAESDPQPVEPAALRSALATDRRFVEHARVTFEPGGQLEMSPGPCASVAQVVADAEAIVARAKELAAAVGVELVAAGTNPWHSCDDIPLRDTSPRYLVMADILGPAGPRMMRLTASLQICVDLLPGRAGHEQWLVANLASPVLAAAFANSGSLDGQPAGIPGVRTAIWDQIDRRCTGYDGRHLDPGDPVGAYARFLAEAPRFPLPEASDHRYHATTVFPPVRPRGGYLEIRALDALPVPRLGEAVRAVATLLTDEQVRRDALDILLPTLDRFEASWTDAACGQSPLSEDLLDLTRDGVARCVA